MAIWKIAAVGLESREHALLETTIDLAAGIETGRWQIVSEQATAQVIIANTETPEGQAILQQEPSQTGALVIPYTNSAEHKINGLTLVSPLSYKSITSLLKKLEAELNSRKRVKAAPIVNLEDSTEREGLVEVNNTQVIEQTEKIAQEVSNEADVKKINTDEITKHKIDWLSEDEVEEFETEPLTSEVISSNNFVQQKPSNQTFVAKTQLLGLIFNSIESGKTTQISHANYPVLRIFPDNGWFIFTEELDSYPEMFREPAESFTLDILDNDIKDELFSGRLPQSLWKLLFTAALFGSEGRLLENLDSEKPFHLVHMPYFGMIPHTADHVTTAEFLVNNHKNLEAINNDINIDTKTIIDFCNACDAIQLLRNEDITHDEKVEMSAKDEDLNVIEDDNTIESEIIREISPHKKSGLINSLWSNLTKTS